MTDPKIDENAENDAPEVVEMKPEDEVRTTITLKVLGDGRLRVEWDKDVIDRLGVFKALRGAQSVFERGPIL